MAVTEHRHADGRRRRRAAEAAGPAGGLAGLLGTVDHVGVGRLFVVASLLFLLVGRVAGVLVGAERLDTADVDVLDDVLPAGLQPPRRPPALFLFLVPAFLGLAIAVVPLQVGAATIAFPRAAAASFWAWFLSGGVLIASYVVDGGPRGADRDGVLLWVVGLAGVRRLAAPRHGLRASPRCWPCAPRAWASTGCRCSPGRCSSPAPSGCVSLPVLARPALVLAYVDVSYGAGLGAGPSLAWASAARRSSPTPCPPSAAPRRRAASPPASGCATAASCSAPSPPPASSPSAPTCSALGRDAVDLPGRPLRRRLLRPRSCRSSPSPAASPTPCGGARLQPRRARCCSASLALPRCSCWPPSLPTPCGSSTTSTSSAPPPTPPSPHLAVAAGIARRRRRAAPLVDQDLRRRAQARASAASPPSCCSLGGLLLAVPDFVSGFLDQPFGCAGRLGRGRRRGAQHASSLARRRRSCSSACCSCSSTCVGAPRRRRRRRRPADPWGGHTLEWRTASPPDARRARAPRAGHLARRPLLDAEPTGGGA